MTLSPTREERIAAAKRRFVERAQDDARLLREQARWLDPPTERNLEDIRETAHRLAGTAGSYGFLRASEAARDLLTLIALDVPGGETVQAIKRLSDQLEQMAAGES